MMARGKGPESTKTRIVAKRIPALNPSRAFGQKSPLIDADLDAFIANCMSTENWQSYSAAEKEKILGSLPRSEQHFSSVFLAINPGDTSPDSKEEADDGSPTPLTRSSMDMATTSTPPMTSSQIVADFHVKRAIARFKRDLADGYYEKAWQDKAKRAHKERMQGKFDEHVQQQAEKMFDDEVDGNDESKEQDELAHDSEDGDYLDTTTTRGKARRGAAV